jgi:glucose/arabinose dehydrogenase
MTGLDMPAGVAWYKGALYVSGNLKGKGYVWRIDNIDSYAEKGQLVPMSAWKVITDRLPSITWHGRRYLRFHPRDPGQLYFGVGSPCDHCDPTPSPNGIQFATIYKLDVGSGQLSLVARGKGRAGAGRQRGKVGPACKLGIGYCDKAEAAKVLQGGAIYHMLTSICL